MPVVGGQHLADARPVDGHRLLGEDVLARRHRRLEVHRPEARRRRQDDVVDARGVYHLLVGVQPTEGAALEVDLVAQVLDDPVFLGEVGQPAAEVVGLGLEEVADGDDLDALGGLQDVLGGAGAPAAAADQADLDGVGALGVDAPRGQQGAGRGGGPGRGQELAPRALSLARHSVRLPGCARCRMFRRLAQERVSAQRGETSGECGLAARGSHYLTCCAG
jgi:hypothetical protein